MSVELGESILIGATPEGELPAQVVAWLNSGYAHFNDEDQLVIGDTVIDLGGEMPDLFPLGCSENPVLDYAAARPSGIPKVFWQTPTEPVNWLPGDEWTLA